NRYHPTYHNTTTHSHPDSDTHRHPIYDSYTPPPTSPLFPYTTLFRSDSYAHSDGHTNCNAHCNADAHPDPHSKRAKSGTVSACGMVGQNCRLECYRHDDRYCYTPD